ncbi:hypothetical protein BJY00DRAFT_111559 [Aspergillus carlsbadensis]|nr:hypothetical protein BJY00DRAFT_111559 [Aspergillus carlsbadensis]
MRRTLRRSCAACAKFKHSCDLRTPRCTRCIKRNVLCVYANEPLTAAGPVVAGSEERGSARLLDGSGSLTGYRFASLDPFDSYPSTRLPRGHVQRLIHSFLHKIAFQYYPLDLNASSNPFLVSWWPLALGDPALFHVSLQTACLDEELLAQRGFPASEILMADSVALLRRKVEDPSLAVQDGTMNSVITLAAIEFGKGNTHVSQMHVDGVKKLVDMRGGINAVRQTSPLTARMVSWVSMLVMGHPQFNTQDDHGIGDGIAIVPEWQMDLTSTSNSNSNSISIAGSTSSSFQPEFSRLINELDLELPVKNVLLRLRAAFDRAQHTPFQSTRLHDLTCFVIHRLLLSAPLSTTQTQAQMQLQPQTSPATEAIRYAIILYMFIIHGPTYYSHAVIMDAIVSRFIASLTALDIDVDLDRDLDTTHRTRPPSPTTHTHSLNIWCTAIGLVASAGTPSYTWFRRRAQQCLLSLPTTTTTTTTCPTYPSSSSSSSYPGRVQGPEIRSWTDVLVHVRSVLWMDSPAARAEAEAVFRPHWDALFAASAASGIVGTTGMRGVGNVGGMGGRGTSPVSSEMSVSVSVSGPSGCFGDLGVSPTVSPASAATISPRCLSLVMEGDTMEVGG